MGSRTPYLKRDRRLGTKCLRKGKANGRRLSEAQSKMFPLTSARNWERLWQCTLIYLQKQYKITVVIYDLVHC